jgi:alpha-glucuronidase
MWRAFVYGVGKIGGEDLALQSFETFMPLDGKFDDNVVLQIKNGPMDFNVREPLHPLLGGLKETNVMMETQVTQEYTGQGIHVISLTKLWEWNMRWDTLWWGEGSTIGRLLSGDLPGGKGQGMACISNFGNFANWTGHVLVASNAYGCGRLGWDPTLSSAAINAEWAAMTFPDASGAAHVLSDVVSTVTSILERSWEAFEGYTSPLGIGFLMAGDGNPAGCVNCAGDGIGTHRGPCMGQWINATHNDGNWSTCPQLICPDRPTPGVSFDCWEPRTGGSGAAADHYWLDPCANFNFNNATEHGMGCDRSRATGTGFAGYYSPALRAALEQPETTPVELLLFFHNLPWETPLAFDAAASAWRLAAAGDEALETQTLLEYVQGGHAAALEEARRFGEEWALLAGQVDGFRHGGVQARLAQQLRDATTFKELLVGYWTNLTKH